LSDLVSLFLSEKKVKILVFTLPEMISGIAATGAVSPSGKPDYRIRVERQDGLSGPMKRPWSFSGSSPALNKRQFNPHQK